MLQNILKSNNPLHYWIIVLLGLFGIGVSLIFFDKDIALNCFIFPDFFNQLIINPVQNIVISYLILFITAFGLISINKEFGDIMGILLPSTVLTLFLNLLTPTVLLINGVFVLPVFTYIMKLIINRFDNKQIFTELFYIGFLIGLSTMVNLDFIVLLLIALIGLMLFRTFYHKEYLVLILCVILPYIILDSLLFIFSDIHVLDVLDINLSNISFDYSVFLSSFYPLLVFLIFTIFVYIRILNKKVELKKIKNRKIFIWINISLLLVWFWVIITAKLHLIYLLAFLLAITFSIVLTYLPNKLHAKLLLIVLFLLNIITLFVV